MTYTLIIIIITLVISFIAFNNSDLLNKLILWPARMHKPEEYYRFITSGFIHADIGHLLFNMFALYSFGDAVEAYFAFLGMHSLYVVMYLAAIIAASIPSYMRHRNDGYYRSLGASGGIAAVIFSSVYFAPWGKIGLIIIPGLGIPSILFAILYLVYCVYMDRRGGTNINHGAHFWGAVFGFLFTLVADPTHGRIFFSQVMP